MISVLVRILARKGIYLSHNPNEKYFPIFVERIHAEIIRNALGVLHIGAHEGQEAENYWSLKKPVIWVEAIPLVYEKLLTNIEKYSNQQALNVILGDEQGKEVSFNISSNGAQSSSLFRTYENGEKLSFVMVDQLQLIMKRLDQVITEQQSKKYNHWIVDVQGAELHNCRSLQVEVSTKEIYDGGVQFAQLVDYLSEWNFYPLWIPPTNFHGNLIFLRK